MIFPIPSDIAYLAMCYLDRDGSITTYRLIIRGICESRGVKAVEVEIENVPKPCFNLSLWKISLPRLSNIGFFHEVAHVISIMDNGNGGSDDEAEIFAHGVCLWLWPDIYENVEGIDWYDMEERELRSILWTRNYLERTSESWKKAGFTFGSSQYSSSRS